MLALAPCMSKERHWHSTMQQQCRLQHNVRIYIRSCLTHFDAKMANRLGLHTDFVLCTAARLEVLTPLACAGRTAIP